MDKFEDGTSSSEAGTVKSVTEDGTVEAGDGTVEAGDGVAAAGVMPAK